MPIPAHALILTAGLGTRLDPLTRVRAKAAVPIAGEPLARRIVRWLVEAGVTEITCNLHHLPHTLTAALGDGADLGARVRYSWEQPQALGSGGGPRQALDIIGADPFFILNGDTLTDVSLERVWQHHQRAEALVTLALVPNREPMRYGGVLLDAGAAVRSFVRKGPAAVGSFHFFGVQVVSAGVFAPIVAGTVASTIGGIYDRLIVDQPGRLQGVVVDATSWDIGTVADYRRTCAVVARGTMPVGRRSICAPSAELRDTIVWDDVSIGEHAVLDTCIVTDGVRVPEGVSYSHAVLVSGHDGQITAVPLPAE